MKLLKGGIFVQLIDPSDRPEAGRKGWGRHLLWTLAIAASLCLMNSSVQAQVDDGIADSETAEDMGEPGWADEAEDCKKSCLIQQRKDDLVCGQKAQECFERTFWVPWWISKSARATCQTSLETCEMVSLTDNTICVASCDEEQTRQFKEWTRQFEERTQELLEERRRELEQMIRELKERKLRDKTT